MLYQYNHKLPGVCHKHVHGYILTSQKNIALLIVYKHTCISIALQLYKQGIIITVHEVISNIQEIINYIIAGLVHHFQDKFT